jgi:CBS domain containing-hemolysin-like protein
MTEDLERDLPLLDRLFDQQLVVGYEHELVGQLADRMAETERSRVPILRSAGGVLVGLVACRDLLRVRAGTVQHERRREALIRLGGMQ